MICSKNFPLKTRIYSPFSAFLGHQPTPRGDAGYPWDGRVREVHAGDLLETNLSSSFKGCWAGCGLLNTKPN